MLKITCSPLYLHPRVSSPSFLAVPHTPVDTHARHPTPTPRLQNTLRSNYFLDKAQNINTSPAISPLLRAVSKLEEEGMSRDHRQFVSAQVLCHVS
ncbi:hypothetical protein E2C01_079463 [Portunus trituberculatus]|uniref:Uncharacterized protein n=1 Tax=Portunus trituberculatus TaxID=210409 RepID=A0A5B7ISU3_PORTR|nr:hypothetical protein [Portunus trituberculatus]